MIIKTKSIDTQYVKLFDLQEKEFIIPIFQRFYEWTAKNVEQLLKDIDNMINNSLYDDLYLLNFIYYEKDNKIYLADGQQRLLTINIFIKAINKLFTNNSLINYFKIHYQTEFNNEQYQNLFTDKISKPFSNVYKKITKFLDANKEKIKQIIEIITNKITINFIKCENADNAFKIFCEINTGGKKLSKNDLIISAVEQYCQNYDIDAGFIKDENINPKQVLTSYFHFKTKEKIQTFGLEKINNFLANCVAKDKKSISEFSQNCKKIIRCKHNNFFKPLLEYIKRPTLANILDLFSLNDIDVLANDDYKKVFLSLCFLSILLSFKKSSGSSYRYLLDKIIVLINDKCQSSCFVNTIIDYVDKEKLTIKKEEFLNFIGNAKKEDKNLKEALLIIDILKHSNSATIDLTKINLEHIYPLNPDLKWTEKGWPANATEQNIYQWNIGNFLLLNNIKNLKIKNKYIKEKYNTYKDQIENYDTLFNTVINFKSININDWINNKEKAIINRQNKICDEIYSSFFLAMQFIKE